MNTETLFEKFNNKKVFIIGDLMLDAYIKGTVDRISPEAPVPVVLTTQKDYRLGGAGNVAANIVSLGAKPFLCSWIGKDWGGEQLLTLLNSEKMSSQFILASSELRSTVKTRIIGNKIQMLRIDEESNIEPSQELRIEFEKMILKGLSEIQPDVIIFEDYDKGSISKSLIEKIVEYAITNKIPIAVDPKKKNFYNYQRVNLFKPNLKELNDACGSSIKADEILAISETLRQFRKKMPHQITLLTLSEHGVIAQSEQEENLVKAHIRNISDVSGAGDSVISVAALCLAVGANQKTLTELSNLAGGIVCEYPGVVPINKSQLAEEASKYLTLSDF